MQTRVKAVKEEFGQCGCGRSPTGKCIGWHGLSEEKFREELAIYEQKLLESFDENTDTKD